MKKPLILSTVTLLAATSIAQIHLQISTGHLPPYHPAAAELYLAGNFNGWNPADSNYKFTHSANGTYTIRLNLPAGEYEYKITRGDWNTAECLSNGNPVANHKTTLIKDDSVTLDIAEWQDRFAAKPKEHTAGSRVQIADTAFWMPQLKRTRRIWIYLPEDAGTKRYPVFYLHDGQNLFDEATAFAGEWGLDEFMDSTSLPKAILVGIDNGGLKRMNEYNPYDNTRFGTGEGKVYLDFIVQTLKPWIDQHYPTKTDPAHTYIAGSSMGGLISMQAVIQYPDVFGAASVMSPSFWIAPDMKKAVEQTGEKLKSRIYFYAGEAEDATLVPQVKAMDAVVKKYTKAQSVIVTAPNEMHNEAAWRKAFPEMYKWIMKED